MKQPRIRTVKEWDALIAKAHDEGYAEGLKDSEQLHGISHPYKPPEDVCVICGCDKSKHIK